jgi:hypothetical protein
MTPKEKAEELVRKYYSLGINKEGQTLSWYECKQCALIAIDEVLKYSKAHGFIGLTEEYEQIKKEIEKL